MLPAPDISKQYWNLPSCEDFRLTLEIQGGSWRVYMLANQYDEWGCEVFLERIVDSHEEALLIAEDYYNRGAEIALAHPSSEPYWDHLTKMVWGNPTNFRVPEGLEISRNMLNTMIRFIRYRKMQGRKVTSDCAGLFPSGNTKLERRWVQAFCTEGVGTLNPLLRTVWTMAQQWVEVD